MSESSMRWPGYVGIFLLTAILMPSTHLTEAFGIPEFLEFGECANTTNKHQLDLNRYSGVWFAQEMVPNEYSEIESCSMTNYTWRGDVMRVVERGLSSERRKMRQNSILRPDEEQEGQFVVDAEGVPSAPFQIVATDYDNYACVHSCMAFMGFRAAFSWVYTRQPEGDHAYVVLCRDLLAEQGVDPTPLKPMKQGKDCPYMDKLPGILAFSEGLQRKAKARAQEELDKAKAIKVQKEMTPPIDHDSTLTEDIQRLEEVEVRLQEEETRLLNEMEEERRRQEEERRLMEEERHMEEEERRRMEEERLRMEDERRVMEEERTRLEDERRQMDKDRREEKEEIIELREDVRADIRRNHKGSKHRTDAVKEDVESSANSHHTSLASMLIAMCLTTFIAL